MFLEVDALGGRKLVEVAVIEGEGGKKTLISLDLLKKWDLIHSSFPHKTISDYIDAKYNKRYQAYSSLYDFQSNIYQRKRPIASSVQNVKK